MPPKPNELIPASRAPVHGSTRVETRSRSSSNGIPGLGCSKCRLGGMTPCRIMSATLISEATPAAASRWPMLDLTEPTMHGRAAGRSAETTAPSARSSIGSPRNVPVPWASTYWISDGSTRASAQAPRITASCALGLGAIRPLLRPSWVIALPRITA